MQIRIDLREKKKYTEERGSSVDFNGDMGVKQKIRLAELAAQTGCSISQASRALNPKAPVAPELRRRILELAQTFHYRNFNARHIRNIAVISELSSEFPESVYLALGHTQWTVPVRLILVRPQDAAFINSVYFEGAISVLTEDGFLREWGKLYNLPLVAINDFGKLSDQISSIFSDADRESELAVEHLISLGHSKLARLRFGVTDSQWHNRGLAGFENAVEKHRVRHLSEPFFFDTIEDFRGQLPELIQRKFTGFIAVGFEDRSGELLKIFQDYGIIIPRDASLITYENRHLSNFTQPALTTIGYDFDRIAQCAASALEERIDDIGQPHCISVSPQLILRDSTGPAPKY